MNVLVFNPGSASLKFEVVALNSPPVETRGILRVMLLRGLEDPLRNAYDMIWLRS